MCVRVCELRQEKNREGSKSWCACKRVRVWMVGHGGRATTRAWLWCEDEDEAERRTEDEARVDLRDDEDGCGDEDELERRRRDIFINLFFKKKCNHLISRQYS